MNLSTTETASPLATALAANAVAPQREVRAYDFRRPTKLSRDHVRVLQVAFETYARQVTTLLTSSLRTGARLDYDTIEQVGYDDYVASLENPGFNAVFGLDPLNGKGMLALDLTTSMMFIDLMAGGSGNIAQPKRSMTSLETQIVRELMDGILREFSSSISSMVEGLRPEITAVEHNPALAQTSAGSETVMVVWFDLTVGLRSTRMSLCLPFNSFQDVLKKATSPALSQRQREERALAARQVATLLQEVPVDVSVRFRPTVIDSAALADLQVGSSIQLNHSTRVPMQVVTNDVVVAHALPAHDRKRLVAQIVSTKNTTPKDK